MFLHPSSPGGWLLSLISLSLHSTQEMSERCGPYVVASLVRMRLYDPNLTVPHWHQWKLHLPEVSLACHPSQCTARQEQFLFPVSGEHQQSPRSNPLSGSIHRGFLCCGVLLAVWHLLLPIMQSMFMFLEQFSPSFRPYTVWSGSLLDSRGSSIYPYPALLRKIWNLVVPVHSSERLTSFASVHISLTICSETLLILVWVCLMASTYLNGIGNCSVFWPWRDICEGCMLYDLQKCSCSSFHPPSLWPYGDALKCLFVFATRLEYAQRWTFVPECYSFQARIWEFDAFLTDVFFSARMPSMGILALTHFLIVSLCLQVGVPGRFEHQKLSLSTALAVICNMHNCNSPLSGSFVFTLCRGGLVDRFLFWRWVKRQSSPISHFSFLKYLQCGRCQ